MMYLLDFDGVILNSRDEILINCYQAITGKQGLALAELPADYTARMRRYFSLASRASDLIVLADFCLEHQGAELDYEQFRELKEEFPAPAAKREQLFFRTRAATRQTDLPRWLAHHSAYEGIAAAVRRQISSCALVTNKDRASTLELLEYLQLPFPPEQVMTIDEGLKSHNIDVLANRFSERTFTFIEDHVHNLTTVMDDLPELLITPLLAAWSYVSKEDVAVAQAQNIRIVDEKTAAEIIGGVR